MLVVLFDICTIIRTIATSTDVLDMDIILMGVPSLNYQIMTKISHICSVVIWISVPVITVDMSLNIDKVKALFEPHNISRIKVWFVALVSLIILMYESWMFAYIFELYAITCSFLIQLVILLPSTLVIVNSLHQPYLFVYCQHCLKDIVDQDQWKTVATMTKIGALFNISMILHLLCMMFTCFITNNGVFNVEYEVYCVVPLGVVELLYRLWAARNYYYMLMSLPSLKAPEAQTNGCHDDVLIINKKCN